MNRKAVAGESAGLPIFDITCGIKYNNFYEKLSFAQKCTSGKPGEEIMNENVKIVFGLLGGLALFLYGMNV